MVLCMSFAPLLYYVGCTIEQEVGVSVTFVLVFVVGAMSDAAGTTVNAYVRM